MSRTGSDWQRFGVMIRYKRSDGCVISRISVAPVPRSSFYVFLVTLSSRTYMQSQNSHQASLLPRSIKHPAHRYRSTQVMNSPSTSHLIPTYIFHPPYPRRLTSKIQSRPPESAQFIHRLVKEVITPKHSYPPPTRKVYEEKRSEVKQKQPPEPALAPVPTKKRRLEAHAGTRQDGKSMAGPHKEDTVVVSTKRATSHANQPRRKSIQKRTNRSCPGSPAEGRKHGVYVVKGAQSVGDCASRVGCGGGRAGGPNKNRHYRR